MLKYSVDLRESWKIFICKFIKMASTYHTASSPVIYC